MLEREKKQKQATESLQIPEREEAIIVGEEQEEQEGKYGLGRYFLLTMFLSFIGWTFETTYIYFAFGKLYNTGFMTLPFCPIYGCSLFAAYFFLGTPDCGRFFLKRTESKLTRYARYFLFAFLIPTVAELLVGVFFDRVFDVRLWSYADVPMNWNGYVCLPVSLIWSGLIFLFMKFAFLPIMRVIGKLPSMTANGWAFALLFIVLVDFSLNLARIIY